MWVANCFLSNAGPSANVVRIDASTLEFEATWAVPAGEGLFRSLAYGGGSLWIGDVAGGDDPPDRHTITEVDPQTGRKRSTRLAHGATSLAWSEGYGDLWMSNFDRGSMSRLHAATGAIERVDGVGTNPGFVSVAGDVMWVGEWAGPQVIRLGAVGSIKPSTLSLPTRNRTAGVWTVAAGTRSVWAATPRDGALWRIEPKTNEVTRIAIPHLPTGVAASANDVCVVVRDE